MIQGVARRRSTAWLVAVMAVLAWAPCTFAPMVRMAMPLDKIAEQADFILKARVISTAPVSDDWFEKQSGFRVESTRMQVLSVIKGVIGDREIEFRHYSVDRQARIFTMVTLQQYEFQSGRSYIVFAGGTNQDGILRQLWKNLTVKPDQGVYLAAEGPHVIDKDAKNVLFTEFRTLLASTSQQDVLYAVRQLDEMSNPDGRVIKLQDFARDKVFQAINPLMSSRDEQISGAAIEAIGGTNPYFKDEYALFWLARIGGSNIPGIGKWQPDDNPGAHQYYPALIQIADGDGSLSLRIMAIRALGRSGQPAVLDAAVRWAHASEPQIRAAGTLLLGDFHDKIVGDILLSSAADPDFTLRKAAARAIGFGQFADLLPVLNRALRDENQEVRAAAALSLVSFPVSQSRDILRANLEDPEYMTIFVNVLAAENAEPYLDALCRIVEGRLEPRSFWGGTIPYAQSGLILLKYLQAQRAETLRSGRFDRQLETLEKARIFSSSEPRDLYELYIKNGMRERAAKFRAFIRRTASFDMEVFFDRVDVQYGISKRP
jgi:hypothetical protein